MKSRLTGASRALDIALPQIVHMNSLMNGVVYDWATVLLDRMYEFITLQYHTFYMPHYAIGLFLEATLRIPLDKLEPVPKGKLVVGEPLVFYGHYLDTGGTTVGQKRPRQVVEFDPEDVDSGRETTIEPSGSDSEAEDGDSAREEAVARFVVPLLPPSTNLTPIQTGVVAPSKVPKAMQSKTPEVEVRPSAVLAMKVVPVVEVVAEFEVAEGTVMGAEQQRYNIGPGQVQVEVVGVDAVVIVDNDLLEDPSPPTGPSKKTTSSWLQKKFSMTILEPIGVAILSPRREQPQAMKDLEIANP